MAMFRRPRLKPLALGVSAANTSGDDTAIGVLREFVQIRSGAFFYIFCGKQLGLWL